MNKPKRMGRPPRDEQTVSLHCDLSTDAHRLLVDLCNEYGLNRRELVELALRRLHAANTESVPKTDAGKLQAIRRILEGESA